MKKCSRETNDKIIALKEKRSKLYVLNGDGRKHIITQVDGCLIEKGIRCDYLVTEYGIASALIELKGSDVVHAIEQIEYSIRNPNMNKLLEKKFCAIIICTRYPRIDSKIQRSKSKFAQKYKGGLHFVCKETSTSVKEIASINGKVR